MPLPRFSVVLWRTQSSRKPHAGEKITLTRVAMPRQTSALLPWAWGPPPRAGRETRAQRRAEREAVIKGRDHENKSRTGSIFPNLANGQ